MVPFCNDFRLLADRQGLCKGSGTIGGATDGSRRSNMNKIAALFVATALAGSVFGYASTPPGPKAGSRKIEVKKPMAGKNRKGKKPQTLGAVSRLHNPDFPWQMPT
jgi:hypothetical protein